MQKAEDDSGQTGIGFGDGIDARKVSMPMFAQVLSGYMDHPVLDLTELHGSYNFKLNVSVQELVRMQSDAGAR